MATTMALLLSGCGLMAAGDDKGATVQGTITIGFVNGGTTEFHTCLQKAVEDVGHSNFARIRTAESRQDAATELSNIEDMIARKVDALIVQTVNAQALKADVAKARSAGIPIFFTSVAPDDTSHILGAVVVDLKKVGRLDAGWIQKDAAGRHVQVGVVAGAPGAASDLLVGGFTTALPGNAQVVANQPGMFDPAKARTVAANMIEAHPDLDYAFVANEEMAFSVRKAFDAAGAKDVKIVTVNGTDEGLAALKDGRFSATVSNSAADTGELAVTNAIDLLRGRKAEKIAKTPAELITKANADTAPLYCQADGY
ncbi:sugar ABC transporter substrate-binding protein [Streptomyces sp. NPDC057257]|uniref:sugar ABC transporter substrate-binding protein n=1 Tax=Streptomyces sp. NPDC057257 TaxID=3346071 RepID=UPI003633C6EE